MKNVRALSVVKGKLESILPNAFDEAPLLDMCIETFRIVVNGKPLRTARIFGTRIEKI